MAPHISTEHLIQIPDRPTARHKRLTAFGNQISHATNMPSQFKTCLIPSFIVE